MPTQVTKESVAVAIQQIGQLRDSAMRSIQHRNDLITALTEAVTLLNAVSLFDGDSLHEKRIKQCGEASKRYDELIQDITEDLLKV